MELTLGSDLLQWVTLAVALTSTLFFLWVRRRYQHFSSRGAPGPKPWFLLGNLPLVMLGRESFAAAFARLYAAHRDKPYIGVFNTLKPLWLVMDRNLLERILVRDFSNFTDRGLALDEDADPLEAHIFNLKGHRWRALRAKLSPIFTSGKIKGMFTEMVSCTDGLIRALEMETKDKGQVDIKDMMARYTTDVIGSCAFGYQPAALNDPEKSNLRRIGRLLMQPSWRQLSVNALRLGLPDLYLKLKMKFWPREVYSFFEGLFKQTVEGRLRTGLVRRDFIQLLLQLKEKGNIEMDFDDNEEGPEDEAVSSNGIDSTKNVVLTDDLLMAQAFIFFFAGYETTSTSLTYTLYELARFPEVQEKARKEVREMKEKHGEINYAAVNSMSYLEACFAESVRLHSPVGVLFRECAKDYKLDDGVIIPKGDQVFISVQGMHKDPEFYPEPDLFKPERFLGEGKDLTTREKNITYTIFGAGPRLCIGKRFAVIEIKATLAKILDSFRIEKGQDFQDPLKTDPKVLVTTPKDAINIRFIRIKD